MRVCVSFSRCCRVPVCCDPQLSYVEQSRATSVVVLVQPILSLTVCSFVRTSLPLRGPGHPPTYGLLSATQRGTGRCDAATLSTKNCGSACRCTARTALRRGCSSFRIKRCSDDPTRPGRCPGTRQPLLPLPAGGVRACALIDNNGNKAAGRVHVERLCCVYLVSIYGYVTY